MSGSYEKCGARSAERGEKHINFIVSGRPPGMSGSYEKCGAWSAERGEKHINFIVSGRPPGMSGSYEKCGARRKTHQFHRFQVPPGMSGSYLIQNYKPL